MTLPNALTLAGLGCGLLAIDAGTDGRVGVAVTWIVAALLFDRLDGLVARKMGLTSAVGARLDSLADLVSFGVAPFFVVRATDGGTLTLLAGLAYALAAAWRLASFEEVGLVESRFGRAFVGLPTPAAAAWLVVLISLVPAMQGVLPIALCVAAVAMCSSLLYPKGGPLLGVTVAGLVAALVVQWGLVGLPW